MFAPNFVALPVQTVPMQGGLQPVLMQVADDGCQDGYMQAGWASPQWMGAAMPIVFSPDASQAQPVAPFAACVEAVGPMVTGIASHNAVSQYQEELTAESGSGEAVRRGRPRRRGRRSKRSQGAAQEGADLQGDAVAAVQWDGLYNQSPSAVMMSPTTSPSDSMGGQSPFYDAGMQASPTEAPQVGLWLKRLSSVTEEDLTNGEFAEPSAEQPASKREDSGGSASDASTAYTPQDTEDLGSLEDLLENQEACNQMVARLDSADRPEKRRIIHWLLPEAMTLALSRCGCRVVQKALEAAGGAGRDVLVAQLEPNTVALYESLHGNHVLTKMIEMLPSAALKNIIAKLWEKGATTVARHRFGCRVFERLIEHCSENEIGALLDQIVADSEALCRHQYGNFVVQHLLEHGSPSRRNAILKRLLPDISTLAMHRTASHVVQRALDYSDEEGQANIVYAMLAAPSPGTIEEVASSRYGSFVAEQLHTVKLRSERGLSEEVARRFTEGVAELAKTHFGKRVAECFGLEVPVVEAEN